METQVFKNETSTGKKLLTAFWQTAAGFGILILAAGVILGYLPDSILAGLILLCGVIAIPGYVIYRWLATDEFRVTTSPAGLMVSRKGRRSEFYKWQDVTATEIVGDGSSESGIVNNYSFHIYFTYGNELICPQSMESFQYFVHVINRAAPHLPYAWEYLDWKRAREIGTSDSWARIDRKPLKVSTE